jgi:hypothetical protein
LIYFIAGLPFFIPGLLINYLPFRLTHLLTWKLIREKEFYVSIGTGVAMVLYLIWYLLLGLLLQAFLPVRVWTPGILLFFLLCGAFSVRFYSLPKKIMGQWRMFRNASLTKDLKTERDVLLQLINKF